MRAVVQRVAHASVGVGGEVVAQIRSGLVVLVGVAKTDTATDADWIADKVAGLRVFANAGGEFSASIDEVDGEVLIVSQFTLLGDVRKGRRPSFTEAALPEAADALYQRVQARLRARGIAVRAGRFRAHMHVGLVNDGPVTLLLESPAARTGRVAKG